MNRFLKFHFFRVSLLFCVFGATGMPAAVSAVEEAGEYIKSMAVERTQCRERFRDRKLEEAAESCRAWVTLANDTLEKAEALSVLGQLYATQGDMDEAQASLDEAASYLQRNEDPQVMQAWVRYQALRARFAEGRDQMGRADFLYAFTEERARNVLGEGSVAFGLATENRASFVARRGDMPQATALYVRAVAAYDKSLGPYNERSLETVLNLAVAQLDHGLKDQAEKTLKTLLAAMKMGKRERSEGAAEALTFLGNLRVENNDLQGALAHFREALALRQSLHGPRDLRTAQSLNSIGVVQVRLGDLTGAEASLSSAYAIRVAALGPDDALTQGSLDAVRTVIELQKSTRRR